MFKTAALKSIRFYQRFISPMLPPACRYTPTCSHYAAEAIAVHGVRGLWMSGARLLRCHPFARGGFDPVPLPKAQHTDAEEHRPAPAA